ncbi:hypothetical protein [Lacticaseibacillus absianus]|uniref:hypothetical protein n=1 Tax=Lacticaseibacillus absianus TaxID=2729623 RepID=UPI0015CA57C8|nr:hypothetical protein [Lacticaseibacillus absianus]
MKKIAFVQIGNAILSGLFAFAAIDVIRHSTSTASAAAFWLTLRFGWPMLVFLAYGLVFEVAQHLYPRLDASFDPQQGEQSAADERELQIGRLAAAKTSQWVLGIVLTGLMVVVVLTVSATITKQLLGMITAGMLGATASAYYLMYLIEWWRLDRHL